MENVTEKGQKFKLTSSNEILTAKSFYGSSVKKYDTLKQAKEANTKDGLIVVENEEYGGVTYVSTTIVVS